MVGEGTVRPERPGEVGAPDGRPRPDDYRGPVVDLGLGVCFPAGASLSAPALADLGAVADEMEVEVLWVVDGAVRPGGFADGVTVAGALARCTRRCSVGVLTDLSVGRAPSVLAKEITALDVLSDGRAALGIGWGAWWPGQPDGTGWTPTTGLPRGGAPVGTRLRPQGLADAARWVEEAAMVCRGMWSASPFTFAGRHLSVTGAVNHPAPVRGGGPRLLVSVAGRRRALGVAERARAALLQGGAAAGIRRTAATAASYGLQVPLVTRRWWAAGEDAERVVADLAIQAAAGASAALVALPFGGHGTADPGQPADALRRLADAARRAGLVAGPPGPDRPGHRCCR